MGHTGKADARRVPGASVAHPLSAWRPIRARTVPTDPRAHGAHGAHGADGVAAAFRRSNIRPWGERLTARLADGRTVPLSAAYPGAIRGRAEVGEKLVVLQLTVQKYLVFLV